MQNPNTNLKCKFSQQRFYIKREKVKKALKKKRNERKNFASPLCIHICNYKEILVVGLGKIYEKTLRVGRGEGVSDDHVRGGAGWWSALCCYQVDQGSSQNFRLAFPAVGRFLLGDPPS